MRKPEISDEQILAAGRELLEQGREVTGFALRKKIGGGNLNRLRQVWEANHLLQDSTNVSHISDLPTEVATELETQLKQQAERLQSLAVMINDIAIKSSERRVADVLRTAEEQRRHSEKEIADAEQTMEDLEQVLETAQGNEARLQAQLDDCRSQINALSIEAATLRERQTAYEDLVALAKQRESERDEARAENARLTGKLEAVEAQRVELMNALAGKSK